MIDLHDVASFETTMESGLNQFSVNYVIPIVSFKTEMRRHFNKNETALVEDLFEHLDIESDSLIFSGFRD